MQKTGDKQSQPIARIGILERGDITLARSFVEFGWRPLWQPGDLLIVFHSPETRYRAWRSNRDSLPTRGEGGIDSALPRPSGCAAHSLSRYARCELKFSSHPRRGWDSNPRKLSLQRFSRPPQSTTLPPLQGRRACMRWVFNTPSSFRFKHFARRITWIRIYPALVGRMFGRFSKCGPRWHLCIRCLRFPQARRQSAVATVSTATLENVPDYGFRAASLGRRHLPCSCPRRPDTAGLRSYSPCVF
jgi:hypothetical protein